MRCPGSSAAWSNRHTESPCSRSAAAMHKRRRSEGAQDRRHPKSGGASPAPARRRRGPEQVQARADRRRRPVRSVALKFRGHIGNRGRWRLTICFKSNKMRSPEQGGCADRADPARARDTIGFQAPAPHGAGTPRLNFRRNLYTMPALSALEPGLLSVRDIGSSRALPLRTAQIFCIHEPGRPASPVTR